MKELRTPQELAKSRRFQERVERRDFLGLAAFWSFLATGAVMVLGALRLPMPSVFPETGSKFRLGPPDRFAKGTTRIPERNVLVMRDEEGFRAVSLVCTHLGCISQREEDGSFICPCHGSRFDGEGQVVQGPAPSGLRFLEVSRAPNGDLFADLERPVAKDVHLSV